MWKRTLLILALAVVAALIVVACSGPGATGGSAKTGKTLAMVGNSKITVDDFESVLQRVPPFNRRRYATKKGKLELLNKLIEEELFYQEALRRGMDNDSDFTNRMEQIRRGILSSMVKKELYDADIEITEDEVKQYYEDNPDQFQTPETVKVKLILVRVKRNATPEEEAKAKAKAEEALKKLKAGASWDAIVEQYSEDRGTKKKGGLLPKVRKGMRGDEFDRVAFGMSTPNEISEVFRDRRGFNIIQFLEKTEAKLKDFDDVKRTIERRLKQEKLKNRMETTLENLRSKATVTIEEDVLDGVQVDTGQGGMPGMPQMGGENANPPAATEQKKPEGEQQ